MLLVTIALVLAADTPRTALAQAVQSAQVKTGSECLECHKTSRPNPTHEARGIDCQKCHWNVLDGKVKHAGALDGTPPKQMCGQCHAEITERQLTGAHKGSTCDGCHGSIHSDFKRADFGACKSCHRAETTALGASVHGKAQRAVGCSDCHGDVHSPKRKADPLSPVSKILQVSTCGECHSDPYVRAFSSSVHGQGLLKAGLSVAPSCTDCHGAHDISPVKDPASKISRKNVVTTCEKCHTFIVARWKTSAHGQKWTAEDPSGPVCTTCHKGHLTFDPMVYGNHLKMVDTCAECHEKQSESYRDSFHGKATRLGLQVAATCANCHTPHEMLKAADPRSSVNHANLEKTCGQCHQPVNASFLAFDSHMDPRDPRRGKAVHYIWLFMSALLVGVLAFFALHTLLWLQRSLTALARHELHHPPEQGPTWVRRFRPLHMKIHVAIVITFLLLAATGLPLKFSGSGWPRWFEAIFGGLAGARLIHRAMGVITFGYGLAYLAWLMREVALRRRLDLLSGWTSMIPNKKDLYDLAANLRWFLYSGPPVKLDRWAYWEKFDFFAVFWGVPVIGLSGLALWEPLWFTRVLPGWALNVAYLVHSDEALLATGFIFFFHFFHTHLRPGAFPLDTVMFLGGMPLERLQEERPVEYQRLVDSGELEKQKMPPPSEHAVKRAYVFGFITLSIGVLLAAFMLVVGLKTILR